MELPVAFRRLVPARSHPLVQAGQILDALGLTDAFGHASVRTGHDEFLITPRGGPGLVVRADDLVRVSQTNGETLEGDDAARPPESELHAAIYLRRPDVDAVCRVHPTHGIAVSTVLDELRPTTGSAAGLGEVVPIHPDVRLARTREAADAMVDTLADHAALLIRGAGAVTVGPDIQTAVVRAVRLEKAAYSVLVASSAGEPKLLGEEDLSALRGALGSGAAQVQRAWDYYVSRHTTPVRGRSRLGRPGRS